MSLLIVEYNFVFDRQNLTSWLQIQFQRFKWRLPGLADTRKYKIANETEHQLWNVFHIFF